MMIPLLLALLVGSHVACGQLLDVGALVDITLGSGTGSGGCYDIKSQGRFLDVTLPQMYVEQPYFVTFLPKTDDNSMVDNICYTYFALPDNPVTYQVYISRVYCDGSAAITSHVVTQIDLGVFRAASPYCTFSDTAFAYAGCDTLLHYRCLMHGDCQRDYDGSLGYVFGLSNLCRPMGLSCLKKVEEVICDHGIPQDEYYVLPMQLPNKCVTSQICVNTPPVEVFNKAVGIPRERGVRRVI